MEFSQSTKDAISAYARDVNTVLEYRALGATGMWFHVTCSRDIFFPLLFEYREVPRMIQPHPHAAFMLALANNPHMPIDYRDSNSDEWTRFNPHREALTFHPDVQYRFGRGDA